MNTFPFDYYRPVFDDLARLTDHALLENLCDLISPHLPACIESYDLASYGYYKAKNYNKSLEWGQKALQAATTPQLQAAVRANLCKSLMCVNQPETAREFYTENLKQNPQDTSLMIDLSVALYAENRKQQAWEIIKNLKAQVPGYDTKTHAVLDFNSGIHEIAQGNFRSGIKKISSGRNINVWGNSTHKFPIPEWRGEHTTKKKLLVVGEGGAGDEIINARFTRMLQQRGFTVTWASAHGLAGLFQCLPVAQTQNYKNFTNEISGVLQHDLWVPAMNLPVCLDVDISDLWIEPYIQVTQQQSKRGEDILHRHSQIANINARIPRVGIRWAGNPLYDHDLHRTVEFTTLWDQLKHLPCDFYSLQRDTNLQDLAYAQGAVSDLSQDLDTWETTAGVVDNLDIVITSCTSIAHLAAAMGKPVIVMVPVVAYFIWPENQNSSYWYHNQVHVIHQTQPRSWQDVVKKAGEILQAMFAGY